ncbi:MAG TPA: CDP-glucose 4,6-dehydratase [Candidatus Gastranaerophilales bacterium]|nr:CDP-glucose 4,6-dehydratase [Candidatus Gastranaerophilales bacterium]
MNEFWKGKRVFITGHTGFKGSWLALWLINQCAQVAGYSLEAPFKPNLFELANIETAITHIHGDVRDIDALKKAVNSFKPDIVFHMAAQSLVRISYETPVETFATNVMGTINALDAIRSSDSVKVCVNITSDKCYENPESGRAFIETDPMGGYDPYSCSKGCSELVTAAYRRSFLQDRGIATARAGNVIGGGDWSGDRLIPDIVRAILNNKEIIIRNPHSIRPWQHVLEPLRGYLMLAEALWNDNKTFSQGWNFGPDDQDCVQVIEVVKLIQANWIEGFDFTITDEKAFHEANLLKLDCSLAKSQLGWMPIFSINDAVQYTVEWFKAYKNNQNMLEFSLNQIDAYEKKTKGIIQV